MSHFLAQLWPRVQQERTRHDSVRVVDALEEITNQACAYECILRCVQTRTCSCIAAVLFYRCHMQHAGTVLSVVVRILQEGESSFLTKNMKALLDSKENVRKRAATEGMNGSALHDLIQQVTIVYSAWCLARGKSETDSAKSRLQHMCTGSECSVRSLLDVVLQA